MKKETKNETEKVKKPNIISNFKNLKKNYQVVRNSPYASLLFRQRLNKILIWTIIILTGWRVVDGIINYKGFITIVNMAVTVLLGLWIISSMLKQKSSIKKHLEFYKEHGHQAQGYYDTNVDVKNELDDLLKSIKLRDGGK